MRTSRPHHQITFSDDSIERELEYWSRIPNSKQVTYDQALETEKSLAAPKRGELNDYLWLYSPQTGDNITLDMMRAVDQSVNPHLDEDDIADNFKKVDADHDGIITELEACLTHFPRNPNMCYPREGSVPF